MGMDEHYICIARNFRENQWLHKDYRCLLAKRLDNAVVVLDIAELDVKELVRRELVDNLMITSNGLQGHRGSRTYAQQDQYNNTRDIWHPVGTCDYAIISEVHSDKDDSITGYELIDYLAKEIVYIKKNEIYKYGPRINNSTRLDNIVKIEESQAGKCKIFRDGEYFDIDNRRYTLEHDVYSDSHTETSVTYGWVVSVIDSDADCSDRLQVPCNEIPLLNIVDAYMVNKPIVAPDFESNEYMRLDLNFSYVTMCIDFSNLDTRTAAWMIHELYHSHARKLNKFSIALPNDRYNKICDQLDKGTRYGRTMVSTGRKVFTIPKEKLLASVAKCKLLNRPATFIIK